MNTLKSSMKISLFAAILSTLTLHVASAAFFTRAQLDMGDYLSIAAGNSRVDFGDGSALEGTVYSLASTYHVDSYARVWVTTFDEPGYQVALQSAVGNTPYWDQTSLVFKIDAGAGNLFNGGTLSFDTRHMGAWNANNLNRWRASTFAAEPNYIFNGSVKTQVVFSNALQTTFYTKYNGFNGSDGNPFENLTLNLPTGVQSFFAVIGAPVDASYSNDTVRLGGISFNNVAVSAVPEPSTYALVVGGIATLLLIRRRVQA